MQHLHMKQPKAKPDPPSPQVSGLTSSLFDLLIKFEFIYHYFRLKGSVTLHFCFFFSESFSSQSFYACSHFHGNSDLPCGGRPQPAQASGSPVFPTEAGPRLICLSPTHPCTHGDAPYVPFPGDPPFHGDITLQAPHTSVPLTTINAHRRWTNETARLRQV